jgi:hypothetical protein
MTLDIVIYARDAEKTIRPCLDAVGRDLDLYGEPARVVVMDDGSADATASRAHSAMPEAKILRSPAPRGFAAAACRALERTSGEVVLFLDAGAELQPGSLRRLAEHMAGHPECGVCGGALLRADGLALPSQGRFPGLLRSTVIHAGLTRRLPFGWGRSLRYGRAAAHTARVDWVPRTCMAVRRSMVADLGGPDLRFVQDFADVDLCRRASRAVAPRWQVHRTPQVRARLLEQQACCAGQASMDQHLRDEVLYFRKHRGLAACLLNLSVVLCLHLDRWIFRSLPLVGSAERRKASAAVLRGGVNAALDTHFGAASPRTC